MGENNTLSVKSSATPRRGEWRIAGVKRALSEPPPGFGRTKKSWRPAGARDRNVPEPGVALVSLAYPRLFSFTPPG
jgi:hypothetical protein